ncbi:hypothetical protein FAES_2319 [Fibrella aestuarina BUZ 2]|uniref:HEAT repeat domain-containing protein n=1 Tax=Fibrella aestuarina BUZ 2 TaxID=1166018 RepID=I0K875_9BACT|nr:hypothetical protein [Fibrella aestuarina]CCH00328.1 hypothetical protein FAES_2319 [Fibrella aestuarina BUZ 2]
METPDSFSRPSRLLDTLPTKAIQLRIQLNQQLLAGSCGFDKPIALSFTDDEQQVLRVIATERFTHHTHLRKQAVRALGYQRHVDALDELVRLANATHEEETIRLEAIQATHRLAPAVGLIVMQNLLANGPSMLAPFILRLLSASEQADERALAQQVLSLKKNQSLRQQLTQEQPKRTSPTAPKADRPAKTRS